MTYFGIHYLQCRYVFKPTYSLLLSCFSIITLSWYIYALFLNNKVHLTSDSITACSKKRICYMMWTSHESYDFYSRKEASACSFTIVWAAAEGFTYIVDIKTTHNPMRVDEDSSHTCIKYTIILVHFPHVRHIHLKIALKALTWIPR